MCTYTLSFSDTHTASSADHNQMKPINPVASQGWHIGQRFLTRRRDAWDNTHPSPVITQRSLLACCCEVWVYLCTYDWNKTGAAQLLLLISLPFSIRCRSRLDGNVDMHWFWNENRARGTRSTGRAGILNIFIDARACNINLAKQSRPLKEMWGEKSGERGLLLYVGH